MLAKYSKWKCILAESDLADATHGLSVSHCVLLTGQHLDSSMEADGNRGTTILSCVSV